MIGWAVLFCFIMLNGHCHGKPAKKLIIGLAISTLILTATLVAVLVHFTNSEMYLGKKYMELYQSDLLTKNIVDDRDLEKIVKGKFSVKEKVGF